MFGWGSTIVSVPMVDMASSSILILMMVMIRTNRLAHMGGRI